jgi:16S rRNA C967 or C1407 C5-methylase (RsmB/RsmF family)/NOL1/NOP2/fmu family ribosome biogenesis protein
MIQLPEPFETRMKMILGPEFPAFSHSLSSAVSHSIRFNPKKIIGPGQHNPIYYCNTGIYLPERPVYTLDPLFHSGAYYVQESSSMFLEQFILLQNKKKLNVLDLCAAPGGKSTHLSSLLSEDSLLVSNEVIHSRGQILSENLKKWGNPNVVVTCNDPKDFSRLPGFFDVIVVDAPCSGEGLFRRDASAMDEWSESNASHCALRQKRILADIWPALAEGGMLVYSTCTYNPEENEENIAWLANFARVEAISLHLPDEWGIRTIDAGGIPGYRFYPHKVRGEGFFITAVQKNEAVPGKWNARSKASLSAAGKSELNVLGDLIQSPLLSVLKFEESLLAVPTSLITAFEQVKSNLRIIHAGVRIGEIVRDSLNPAHELAISSILNQSFFPQVQLTLEQALSYLKKEDFKLDFKEKGWNLMTYNGHAIGWAKNIGNRFNNSYPKEWRIRMSTTEFTGQRLLEEAAKFPFETTNNVRYEI